MFGRFRFAVIAAVVGGFCFFTGGLLISNALKPSESIILDSYLTDTARMGTLPAIKAERYRPEDTFVAMGRPRQISDSGIGIVAISNGRISFSAQTQMSAAIHKGSKVILWSVTYRVNDGSSFLNMVLIAVPEASPRR